jgi:YVTN family beta-propeller protein
MDGTLRNVGLLRRLALIAAVAFFPIPLFGQTVLNFPRVISTPETSTTISVVNPSSLEVSITLTAFDPSGAPLAKSGVSNPFTATVPAGGNYSRLFHEVYGADAFNGWVQVTSAASGLTGFSYNSNPQGTDVDGTTAVEPVSEFNLPYAAQDATVQTEVTLVNVNNDPAQITLTLYGSGGTTIETKTLSLASKALLRQFLGFLFGDVDFSTASHLKVRSDRPLAGLEVIANLQVPGVTLRRETIAIPGQLSSSDVTYVIPQFITGVPLSATETGFTSYLHLVNGGGVSQEVTLTAYKDDGTLFPGTNPRQEVIAGNASLRVPVMDYFGLPATQVSAGWIEIRGSVGYLSAGLAYGNTVTPAFAMTTAVPVGAASRLAVLNYFAENSLSVTGLSLVNPGTEVASADVFVLRADGATVGHSVLTLSPKQHLSRLIRDVVPGSRDLSGAWIIVRSNVPVVSNLYVGSANGAGLVGVPMQPALTDFIPPAQTSASISGIVQDSKGVEGATVRLSGPVNATKVTDSSGRYAFGQLPPGNYTLSVTKASAQFFPPEQTVSLAQQNLDGVNFLAVGIAPALTPAISLLSPPTTFAGSSSFNVAVFGSNFNPVSVVHLNGQPLTTSYTSAAELRAVVPADLLKQTGKFAVSVVTQPPGGGTSNLLEFTVNEIPLDPLIEGHIKVGRYPAGVAVGDNLNLGVVTSESDDNVSLINLQTLERLGTAGAGRSPAEGIAIHEKTNRAFVGNVGSDNVSVINLETRAEITKIPVGRFPIGVAVSQQLDRVYVANGEDSSVSVIDANSLAVITKFGVGARPGGIAVSPHVGQGIVTSRTDNNVTLFDLVTFAVLGTVPVGQHPRGVAADPNSALAVVANAASNDISLVDMVNRRVTANINVGQAPTGVAIHAESHSAVVTNSGVTKTNNSISANTSVSVVNLDERAVVAEVPVGAAAFGVAVDQRTQRAFVANFGSDTVTVIRIPNPRPKIADVEPKTFPVGGGSFTITVRGTGFLPTSVVTLNGKALPTRYISPTELRAEVTADLLDQLLQQSAVTTGGDKGTAFRQVVTLNFNIEVTNPGPGGGESPPPENPNATKIEPLNTTPVLLSLSPASAEIGKDALVTFVGNNFNLTSVINFGGNLHSPTTVEPTQMTLRIGAGELRAGDVPVSITNPPPGGGTSDVLTFRVLDNTNPVPVITSVTPSDVAAGTASVNVVLVGSGFIPTTSVKIGGTTMAATITPNRIDFTVGADLLRNAASLAGLVTNSAPGGGTASFSLSVLNPVPSVTSFSPTHVEAGTASVEIRVRGLRFVDSSRVLVEGTPVTTRFIDATDLRATVAEGLLRTPGNLKIGVSNPAPGGGLAEGGTLAVEQASPILELLNPASVRIDQKDVTLTLTGRSFGNGAKVLMGTAELNTVFVSSTELKAVLPVLTMGTATISVKNPGANGKVSNGLVLQITAGVPVLTSLTPSSGVVGVPATIRIAGSNFTAESLVTRSGIVVPATFINSSAIDMEFTPAAAGNSAVVVTNTGVGSSDVVAYSALAAPAITLLAPAAVAAESGDFVLTIHGSNFYEDAVVAFGDTTLVPQTRTLTLITVAIPGNRILAPSTLGVTVQAKSAVSNALPFTIGNPDVKLGIEPSGPLNFNALGVTQLLAATARTTLGNVVAADIKWTSSNPGVATVSAAGLLTSVGNGTSTVVATADGLFASVSVTVAQVVNSIDVSPASLTLTSIGATSQFTAVAKDSNGMAVAGKVFTWSSESPSIASVNSSGLATAAANGSTTLRAVVDGKEGSAAVSVGQAVAVVEVSPAAATLNSLNLTQGFTAVAKDANGVVITGKTFTWTLVTPGVASLSATSGVISTVATAAGNGATAIEATVDGKKGSGTLTVLQVVNSVDVVTDPDGTSTTLGALGASLQLRAIVRDANNQLITGKTIGWLSESPDKASISSSGQVTAIANGSAVMRATVDGKSGTLPVNVVQVVNSIQVSPASATLASIGDTAQFTAVAKDSNGNAIAGKVITWSSDASPIATVVTSGLVTAAGNGSTTLRATVDGKQGTALIAVSQVVATVEVSPAAATVNALNLTQTFSAVAKDAKGVVIGGKTFTWASTTAGIAGLSATSGVTSTVATATGNGSTSIVASVDGKTGVGGFTVSQSVASVQVVTDPAGAATTLTSLGATLQLRAVVKDANGQTINGKTVVWASESSPIAEVSSGQVTALANGSSVIRATVEDKTATLTVGVEQVVVSIDVSPATATLASIGETAQFTAVAKDGNGQTVAGKVFSWSPDASAIATVNSSGLATAAGNGSTTLRASVDGKQGSATISVGQIVAVVEVEPASVSLASLNLTQTFTAVAKDAKGAVITGKTFTWSFAQPGVASLSVTNGVTSTVATAAGTGSTAIEATVDGKTGSGMLSVNQVVHSVEVVTDPAGASTTLTALGAKLQLRAVVRDANHQTISGKPIEWVSDSPGKASISSSGQVNAEANGSALMRATVDGKSGTLSVNVGQTLHSITLSPTSKTLSSTGEKQRFTAALKDANGNTVAGTIEWSSSVPGVASIASVDATSADATAVANGTTTITASSGGTSGTATVTVNQAVHAVEVSPLSKTLTALGATSTFTATVKDSLGNTITGQTIVWESTSTSVATINSATGVATAVANGSTTIKATVAGKTGTANLIVAQTIEPPVINALSDTPAGLSPSTVAAESDDFILTINGTKFRGDAAVNFGDTVLTPESVTFTAITVKVPTALINSPGAVSVTVMSAGALSNAVTFTIGNAVVDVMIAPSNSVTFNALGLTQKFTPTAKTTGGTVIPKSFQWTSSNTSVATVTSEGVVTAIGNGSATVVATADGLSGSVAVTVAQVVHSVDVSPSSATLTAIGATSQFSAVVKDSNGQTIAGKTITWSSDATSTATVDNTGLATSAANGSTTLRAIVDGKQGTAAVEVAQVVATVDVSPAAATLNSLSLTQTFTAVAKDAKGVVVSGKKFAWASTTAGIASLSATSGVTSTVATAAGNGNTSIEASVDGKTGVGGLTVNQIVASVEVVTDPASAATTLTSLGATLQLRAVVKDANSQTISGKTVAWVSESSSVAGVSSTGQVTALGNGASVIRATVEDKTSTLEITVGQTVHSLTVTPTSKTLTSAGDKQRFTGTLKDANGNSLEGTIFWSSSSTGVATIAAVDTLNADATAVANGETTITASASGKTATATLTVSRAVATVELSPATKTLDALTDTFTFTATLKDSQGNTITGQTIAWESSATSIATVNAGTGLVTSVANGSATIKATVAGKSATAQLIVAQAVDSLVVEEGGGFSISRSRRGTVVGDVLVQVFRVSSVPKMTSLGDERLFSALAKDRKGQTIEGKTVNWTSSKSDVVTVDATGKARAVGNGVARITASVEGKSEFVDQTVDQVIDSVSVSPSAATLTSLQDTVPLKAIVKDARGNAIAGKSVTWASSSGAATVDGGLVTAVSEASGVTITASVGDKAANAAIAVKQEVASIVVTPARHHFNLHNLKKGFAAIAKDARGNEIHGRGRSWATSRADLAEVNASGEVISKGNGDVVITVTIDGKTAIATVSVAQAAARIEIDQESVLFEGLKSTKPLVARFFDERNIEITKGITWTSSKTNVATISAGGVLTAEGNGVTTITATADGISASISVRVNQKLQGIVISQVGSGKLRALGRKRQFLAKAVDPNGFEIPGKSPKWKSSNDGVAGIDENGEATGKLNGKVNITAEIEGFTQTAELEIDQLAHRIEHASGSGKLKAFKRTRQLRVLDEDGNPIIGKTVSWSSTDSDVAEVDANGVARANKKNGNTKVRAIVDGVTVETDVDVDQDIASIEVSADGSGRVPALNRKRKFNAVAKDPDGNLVVGKSVEWLTSDDSTAPVDSDGNATAKKNGKVQIRAKMGDLTSQPIDFEVSQVTNSVTVTGESNGKVGALNRKRKHTAVAKDPDGNVIDGKTATWSSTRADLATIDSSGEVTAKGNGKSSIKAVIDGVEGVVEFETDQQLGSVRTNETGKIKALNRKRQYRAVDPDGFDLVGKTVSWSTSDGATATVNSGTGEIQAKKNGTARITATVGSQTAFSDAEILQEVASVRISSLEPEKNLIKSFKHKRRSTAVAFDADNSPVEGRTVSWNSSDPSVLPIDSAGDAESKRNGSSKITATIDGIASNTLNFTVSQEIFKVESALGQATGKFNSKKETRQFVAKDANGELIEKPIAWSIGDSAIAEVDGHGNVTSKGNKKTKVHATVDGVTVSADIEVEQVAIRVVISVLNGGRHLKANVLSDCNKFQNCFQLQAKGIDAEGQDVVLDDKFIIWSVDKPTIATITPVGGVIKPTGLSNGPVVVTAKMDDASATLEIDVR